MFSELVDEIAAETRRGVDTTQIVAFINSTVRECQTFKGSLFERDLIEATVTTGLVNPYVWTRAIRFRKMRAAQYVIDASYPKFIAPGRKIGSETNYFYANAQSFNFFGAGDAATINLAYFIYQRRLNYYAEADRPAVYDTELEVWAYLPAYDIDDTQRELARNLVTNWLILDWYDLVKGGAVSKVLTRAKDEEATKFFAAYKSMQNDLVNGELIINMEAAQSG